MFKISNYCTYVIQHFNLFENVMNYRIFFPIKPVQNRFKMGFFLVFNFQSNKAFPSFLYILFYMHVFLKFLRRIYFCGDWAYIFQKVQFSSVAQPHLTLRDPMDRSTPGLPVHHQLLESTQTHVHWVGDAIQPSHPLSSPSSPAFQKDFKF